MAKFGQSNKVVERPDVPHLSDRERTVLLLAADGLTDKEIAKSLGISLKTVGTYWDRMRHKFSATSRTQVLAKFLRIQVADDQEAGRLDRLFATWEEGVWVIGREGETHYVNERVAEILDLDGQVLTKKKAAEIVGAAHASKVRRLISQARTEPSTIELSAQSDGSKPRWLSLRATPFQDDDGHVRATVILVKDITVRKRVEYALTSCETSLAFMMGHSSDLIATFDSDMKLRYVNETFCKMLKLPDHHVIGKHVSDMDKIFAPAARWVKSLDKTLRTGQSQDFKSSLAGIRGRLTTYLLPQPSGDFSPSKVISLTRSANGAIVPRK